LLQVDTGGTVLSVYVRLVVVARIIGLQIFGGLACLLFGGFRREQA
jgi:hypothetical protein